MNTDTGEIRKFDKTEEIPEKKWLELTGEKANELKKLEPEERLKEVNNIKIDLLKKYMSTVTHKESKTKLETEVNKILNK